MGMKSRTGVAIYGNNNQMSIYNAQMRIIKYTHCNYNSKNTLMQIQINKIFWHGYNYFFVSSTSSLYTSIILLN